MAEDRWAESYAIWSAYYDNPTDIARAVVREKIAQAVERLHYKEQVDYP
jgi:hypothetical protein